MKRITESKLNKIISNNIEETVLRKQVRSIVAEEVARYVKTRLNEDTMADMRASVKAWLDGKQGDMVLFSQLAYYLWPDMDKDTARSLFSKKVAGKEGREFTDEEVTKLYQKKNSM